VTQRSTFLPSRLQLDSVEPYSIAPFERAGLLRLDINERPDGAPDFVIDALAAALGSQQIATYPNYADWLALAAKTFEVPQDCVAQTNGADEGIRAIIDAHLLPGMSLVTHVPGFAMFGLAARLLGNPVVACPFASERPGHFAFDSDAWFKALQPDENGVVPGLVAIANPNNPTGAMVPREAIVRTLEAVKCPVVVDETYAAFLGETVNDLVASHDNLFVVHSFSKVHGLAGLRIGAIVSNATNIAGLRRVLNPYNVNRAAVAASMACMEHTEQTQHHIAAVREARKVFVGALDRMQLQTGALHANFVIVHVGEDHARITAALAEEGVLIRDRDGSHPDLAGCVRVAIGTVDQMRRVAGTFRKVLRPPPHIDALLFDMDGTLVDVSKSYRRAIRETARSILRDHGVASDVLDAIDDAYVDSVKARGGLNNDWDATVAIVEDHGVSIGRNEVISVFQALYRGRDFGGYITGEPWLLSATSAARIAAFGNTAVVTGRPRAEAEWTLQRHAPKLWQLLVGMEDTVVDKPNPEPVARGMRLVGGEIGAYIGDSVDDMASASAAGVFAVGVLGPGKGWQSGWPERLHAAGADVVFENVNDAIAWLLGPSQGDLA